MHPEAHGFITCSAADYGARPPTFEVGSRNVNGSVRAVFSGRYCGIDLRPGPDVDVVADGLTFEPPFVPQTIVCCEVLEHSPQALPLLARLCDLLADGGLLLVTTASVKRAPHSGIDGGPVRRGEFYENLLLHDLQQTVEAHGLQVLTLRFAGPDLQLAARKVVH